MVGMTVSELLLIAVVPVVLRQTAAVPVDHDEMGHEKRSSCLIIFYVNQEEGRMPTVTSIKMPVLSKLMPNGAVDDVVSKRGTECRVVFAVQPHTKPNESSDRTTPRSAAEATSISASILQGTGAERITSSYEERKDFALISDMYEQQLAVWPSDVEDVVDAVQSAGQKQPLHPAVPSWAHQVLSPTAISPGIPVYEDQVVVYPEPHFDHQQHYVGEDLGGESDVWPVLQKPAGKPSSAHTQVLENYHVVHPNGTREHKLSLSNGLVTYKKIYQKMDKDQVLTVQEGYESVPVPGKHNEFLTQFYIADEHGYNVYKVEHSDRRPAFPTFLSYRDQEAEATEEVTS